MFLDWLGVRSVLYVTKILRDRGGKLVSHQLLSHVYFMQLILLSVLVSSVYVCSNRHTYVTTDPRVLKLISPECIPFILLHKTGFLKNFVDKVIGLVKEGMCISAIERFIASQRKITETSLFSQLSALSFPSLAECNHILSLVINPRPSNDILNKCFLAEFFLSEGKYNHAMSQLVAKDVISLDHTFKVAAYTQ